MRELIENTRKYLDYVENHYNNVQKAWLEIQQKCQGGNGKFKFITDDHLFFHT